MNHEKPIKFSQHAIDNMRNRGASKEEVELAMRTGECLPAKKGRLSFRKNFSYNAMWKGKSYQAKQVMPIVVEEPDKEVLQPPESPFIKGEFFGGVK